MSYRMYVHKKHDIELGECRFNHSNYEINRIVAHFCPSYWDNNEYTYCGDEVEVPREELKAMIDTPIEVLKKDLGEIELPEEYTLDKVIECLKALYDDADPDNDTIYFSWA